MIDLTGRKVAVNDTDYPVKYTGLIDDLQVAASLPVPPFGHKPSTTAGLTWGYYGGQMWVNGVLTTIADGTLALTASATNYVEHDAAGAVTKNSTAFSADKEPIAEIVTGVASITTITDRRAGRDPVLGGGDGHALRKETGAGNQRIWTPPMITITGGGLINGRITETRAGNALTLHVKHWNGTDASATDPVYALFRDANGTSSQFYIRKITAALNTVVSSGSTAGHVSGRNQHLFVYLIDVAGVVEIAWSNLPPDYAGTFGTARLVTTTAEGGVGGADSATGVYSTTARASVPWVCIAKCISNQATAGTWVTALAQIDMAPFDTPRCEFAAYASAGATATAGTYTKYQMNTEEYDPENIYDSITNYRSQPNVAGVYRYSTAGGLTTITDQKNYGVSIQRNGSVIAQSVPNASGTANIVDHATVEMIMNGTSDYAEAFIYNGDTVAQTTIASQSNSRFCGSRVSR